MLLKIVRIVIGLPFALLLWPIFVIFSVLCATICFICDGYMVYADKQMVFNFITLPYQFIKRVCND